MANIIEELVKHISECSNHGLNELVISQEIEQLRRTQQAKASESTYPEIELRWLYLHLQILENEGKGVTYSSSIPSIQEKERTAFVNKQTNLLNAAMECERCIPQFKEQHGAKIKNKDELIKLKIGRAHV
jgi:hypothetical protein